MGFAFFSCVSWQIKNKYENHSSEICWISSQGHAIWSILSMTNREGLTWLRQNNILFNYLRWFQTFFFAGSLFLIHNSAVAASFHLLRRQHSPYCLDGPGATSCITTIPGLLYHSSQYKLYSTFISHVTFLIPQKDNKSRILYSSQISYQIYNYKILDSGQISH